MLKNKKDGLKVRPSCWEEKKTGEVKKIVVGILSPLVWLE